MAGSPKTPESKEESNLVYKNLILSLVISCIRRKMSKDEAVTYLWNSHRITPETTNWAWGNIDQVYPEFFSYYNELIQKSPPEVDSAMVRRRAIPSGFGEQQQRLPTRRSLMPTTQDFQRDAAASSSSRVAQQAPNANANANDADFRQQLMNTLAKIERNTDQMLKLMSNIHGCGPHRSAAGSLKRQRVEQIKECGNNEEAEKLQEKERGDNEETEKQREGSLKRQRIEQTNESGDNEQEKERGDNGEAEKLQEKERGDNEDAEKLQEKERCDNEEAEKLQDQNLQLPQ